MTIDHFPLFLQDHFPEVVVLPETRSRELDEKNEGNVDDQEEKPTDMA